MEMRPILPRGSANTLRRAGTLTIAAVVGHESLDRRVALLRPVRAALGGEIVLVDDGTLGGADRVRLARAFGDPELIPARAGDGEGALLRAALEGRRNAYWLLLDGIAPPDMAVPEIARAIAANRSFAILGDTPADLAPHLARLAEDGWDYLPASPTAIGLAAGGEGLALADAIRSRLSDAGISHANVLGFLLARERDPVLLQDRR
jgi:hypothetical protein